MEGTDKHLGPGAHHSSLPSQLGQLSPALVGTPLSGSHDGGLPGSARLSAGRPGLTNRARENRGFGAQGDSDPTSPLRCARRDALRLESHVSCRAREPEKQRRGPRWPRASPPARALASAWSPTAAHGTRAPRGCRETRADLQTFRARAQGRQESSWAGALSWDKGPIWANGERHLRAPADSRAETGRTHRASHAPCPDTPPHPRGPRPRPTAPVPGPEEGVPPQAPGERGAG